LLANLVEDSVRVRRPSHVCVAVTAASVRHLAERSLLCLVASVRVGRPVAMLRRRCRGDGAV